MEEKRAIYARKLKMLRLTSSILQKDMAVKFKISQQAYSDLEKGNTNFTKKKIERICKIFKIPVIEFIAIEPGKSKTLKRKADSYNIKILKKYYEGLLLDMDIRIGELEIENKRLRKSKKITKKPELYVMI